MKNECQKEKWRGMCCCTCKYHSEDFYHCTTVPDRVIDGVKHEGCICSIHKGWICNPPEWQGAHSGWSEHGLCEMHEFKPELDPKRMTNSTGPG